MAKIDIAVIWIAQGLDRHLLNPFFDSAPGCGSCASLHA
jgi:hypothetical protein